MLSFEQKVAICASFPELERSDVSLGRVNFQFPESVYDRKNVVYHLHPNGNGFVYAGKIQGYAKDAKGLVNIRDFTEEELRSLIRSSIDALSEPPSGSSQAAAGNKETEERWTGPDGSVLTVKIEDGLWYVYSGNNLDMAFESYEEAVQYLEEEGFGPSRSS
ncbi:hypothetical protein ACFSL6_06420 [Paenibacillus thailandensis]|uniref:Uncharacterized protein n=1 Tax=Paenibacillus thailandensis TaxID=393250 RepID=A0ABW5QUS2_9BACL